jgi:hypothetical protein
MSRPSATHWWEGELRQSRTARARLSATASRPSIIRSACSRMLPRQVRRSPEEEREREAGQQRMEDELERMKRGQPEPTDE